MIHQVNDYKPPAVDRELRVGWEIERKFLVRGNAWRVGTPRVMRQGYLSRAKNTNVRIRIDGNHAFLTIKGHTQGATRREFEYPIPLVDAEQMLSEMCERPLIEKHRYDVQYRGQRWEVDEFLGENAGLVVAEIELDAEDAPLELPEWIDREVTSDPRYFNSNLGQQPYSRWA